jgi:hypothetical protein
MEGTDRRAHQHGRPLHRSPRSTYPSGASAAAGPALSSYSLMRPRSQMTLKIAAQSHEETITARSAGSNAESRRLTAGGCCLLSSKRFMAVLFRLTSIYPARQRTPWRQAGVRVHALAGGTPAATGRSGIRQHGRESSSSTSRSPYHSRQESVSGKTRLISGES